MEKPTLASDLIRATIAVVFVVLNIAFIAVPFALSAIPGEHQPAVTAAAAARHLT